MKKGKQLAALTALLLAISLVSCGSPVDGIMNNLDQHNYSEAVSAAAELNEKDCAELYKKLDLKLDETVKAFAAEKIKQKDALEIIDAIGQMHLSSMQSSVLSAQGKINSLTASKKTFLSGTKLYQDKNYISAMNCFEQVSEEDCRHDDAEKLIQNCVALYGNSVIDQTKEYIAADQYDTAMSYLNKCKREASGCEEAESLIVKLINELGVEEILGQAKQMVKEGDIAAALTTVTDYINETNSSDKRLIEFMDTTHKEYVDVILKKVSELSEKENYIAALKMLSNAKEVVQDKAFDEKEEKIKAVKPTYLYDLTCSNQNHFEIIDEGDPLKDTIGNRYDVGNLFTMSYYSWTSGEQYDGNAEYYLGYQYERFTGAVSVYDDEKRADDTKNLTATLRILGDGETLYTTTVKRSFTPTTFDLDVSKVNWLQITLSREDGSSWGTEGLKVILSDCEFPGK